MLVPKHSYSSSVERAIPRKALTPEEKVGYLLFTNMTDL